MPNYTLNRIEMGRYIGFEYLGALERVLEIPEGTLANKLRELGFPLSHLESIDRGAAKRKKVGRLRTKIEYKLLGDEVHRLKLEKGWTREKLSEETKISCGLLNQLELGHSPAFKHHSRLEKAFGLEEGYFSKKLEEWGLPQSRRESMRRMGVAKGRKPKGKHARMGLEIRNKREEKRWTRKELADKIGVSRSEIAHIEQGVFTGRRYHRQLEELLGLEAGRLEKLLESK